MPGAPKSNAELGTRDHEVLKLTATGYPAASPCAMKRLITRPKWKLWLRKRQTAELRKRFVHRAWKHDERRVLQGQAKPKTKQRRERKVLKAPEVFSLVLAPAESIAYLNSIREGARTHHLEVDLTSVQKLTPDAIAALVATLQEGGLRSSVIGTEPTVPEFRQMLIDSGFYDHVRRRDPISGAKQGRMQKREISLRSSSHVVEGRTAANLIDFATRTLYGELKKMGASYTVFLDAMGNTLEHANVDSSGRSTSSLGTKSWWASVYCDTGRKKACFTLIDLGVGIFNSLQMSRRLRFMKGYEWKDNGEKLEKLLKRQIPSRTGLPYRGRGLPGIYELYLSGRLENLVIISNNAYGRAVSGEFRQLPHQFSGTFIYWEN